MDINQNIINNSRTLEAELKWLEAVIAVRSQEGGGQRIPMPPPIDEAGDSIYAEFVTHYGMGIPERLMLVLTLAPFVRPELFDDFQGNKLPKGVHTALGGLRSTFHNGFLPTVQTVIYLLAGNDLTGRMFIMDLFRKDHYLFKHHIVEVRHLRKTEPFTTAMVRLTEEYICYLTSGRDYEPKYDVEFPAQRIKTNLDPKDLILAPNILDEVEEIRAWLEHRHTLLHDWGMSKHITGGYRALFHGPPGTGKTLTASLLGKMTGHQVYRVNLSQVVSKYIGETEKRLELLFDEAENRHWILFFDEADSLFGKRSNTKDAKDRYANQEVSYLLQRIEHYPGVVILATNFKSNLDPAFARRFQSIINFSLPDAEQRERLWQSILPPNADWAEDVDLDELAEKYALSGGGIVNTMRYAALATIRRGSEKVTKGALEEGLRREFSKLGRMI